MSASNATSTAPFTAPAHSTNVRASSRGSRTQPPLLVEFFGTPGSGKTTLCSTVASELCREGFIIMTRDDYRRWMRRPWHRKMPGLFASGSRTWYLSCLLAFFLYRTTSLRGRALAKATYELACMRLWLASTARCTPCDAIILDEFVCNRLALRLRDSSFVDSNRALLHRLLAVLYSRLDIQWIFKPVPVQLAVARISDRARLDNTVPKPIDILSPARQHALLDRQGQVLRFMYDTLQSRHSDRTCHVDSALPMETQVQCTQRLISELLSARRRRSLASDRY